MTAASIAPGLAGEPDSVEPGFDRVIALSSRRPPAPPGSRVPGFQDGAPTAILRFGLQFTATDHIVLAAWASDLGHGYDRLHVEQGLLEGGNWASYALIYVPGQSWSTWGMTRRDGQIEMWRCATGRTVGHHARMNDALASLPHASDRRRPLPMEARRAGLLVDSRRVCCRNGRFGKVS